MKFEVYTSANVPYKCVGSEIEINTLEELKALQEKCQEEVDNSGPSDYRSNPTLIVDFKEMSLEIYDYYRE